MADCKCLIHRTCPLHLAASRLLAELETGLRIVGEYIDDEHAGNYNALCNWQDAARTTIEEACPERAERET